MELKADRPHPRDYSTHRQRPSTDNDTEGQTDGRTDATKYIISLFWLSYAVDNDQSPKSWQIKTLLLIFLDLLFLWLQHDGKSTCNSTDLDTRQ